MSAVDTIRDALFGNPPSPSFKPSREGVLNAFTELAALLATIGVGVSTFQTKAAMLATTPGTTDPKVAFVIADGTPANNGVYKYPTGGPWSSFTEFYAAVAGVVSPLVALANHYANDSTNVDVPGGSVGERGAKYWAQLALSGVTQRDVLLHAERFRALIETGNLQNAIQNSDGTVTIPATTNCAWIIGSLPEAWDAARIAGTPINFSLDIVSGSLDVYHQIEQYTAENLGGSLIGTATVMDVVTGGYSKALTLDPTCRSFRVLAYSTAGAVTKQFGGIPDYPARVQTDPDLIAAMGYVNAILNEGTPVNVSDIIVNTGGAVAATYDFNVITIPGNSSGSFDIISRQSFKDGDVGTFMFRSSIPLGAVNQAMLTRYDASGGHGPDASIPAISIDHIGGGVYRAYFRVLAPGGQDFFGIKCTFNNPTGGATRQLSDFSLWKGLKVAPPLAKTPAVIRKYVTDQSRLEADGRKGASVPITCVGDSQTHFTTLQKNWPHWLQVLDQDRVDIRARGVPGDYGSDIRMRSGLQACIVTGVTGGVIPADLTPVAITNWDIRPGGGFSISPDFPRSNPDVMPFVYLAGVLGRIYCRAYTGDQPTPGAVYFKRVTPDVNGYATPCPSGSQLIWRDGLLARNHKLIIMGTYNSPSETRTTADLMFAKLLARDGHIKNGLYIPYGVALGSGATNGYTASMASAYPGQVCDVNYAPTSGEQTMLTAKFGTDFSSGTTVSEMAAGYIPQVLKYDNVHFLESGAYLLATRIRAHSAYQAWTGI